MILLFNSLLDLMWEIQRKVSSSHVKVISRGLAEISRYTRLITVIVSLALIHELVLLHLPKNFFVCLALDFHLIFIGGSSFSAWTLFLFWKNYNFFQNQLVYSFTHNTHTTPKSKGWQKLSCGLWLVFIYLL